MVSDRIVDFQFFFKFHRSGLAKIFSFSTLTEQLCIKKAPNQAKDLINMVRVSLEELWMVSDSRFSFFRQISQVRTCNNFQFLNSHRTCLVMHQKSS